MFKSQAELVALVMVMIVFIIIFSLTSLFKNNTRVSDEYYNLYAHNLLLSLIRTDTGYGGICKSFADTIACAITTNVNCGTKTCEEIVEEDLKSLAGKVIKENMDYLLIIEPEGWEFFGGKRIEIGNKALANREKRWSANEKIMKKGSNVNVKLIIGLK
ncbi:MAG: hypothetical protein DRP03_00095 [Candidatus Aenigmatarchaeota archaeon]|nr:MAG: hypothetical protein DRP03_00095 [Candidatus Aenigmarchaeota archaeon]